MRRRLLAAILGTVALAVVLAGTGTYLLVRRQAVRAADTSLRAEVDSLAGLVTATGEAPSRVAQAKIVQGMRLEGISVLVRGPAGVVRGALPDGVDEADVPVAELDLAEDSPVPTPEQRRLTAAKQAALHPPIPQNHVIYDGFMF